MVSAVEAEPFAKHARASHYRDPTRYKWLLNPLWMLMPVISIFFIHRTGNQLFAWLTPALLFVGFPILDAIIGVDTRNHPVEDMERIENDPYYRYLTYFTVLCHYVTLIGGAWAVGTMNMTVSSYLGIAISVGLINGFAVATGHELGHKRGKLERWLGKMSLAISAYGQYIVDHNRGHHRDVATPEDSGSSKMGETFYAFVLRQIPHSTVIRPWQLEKERLARKGKGPWSLENEFIQPALVSLVLFGSLIAIFGAILIPYLFIASALAYLILALADYTEHYGLLRERLPDGRYARVRPEHSWNTDHVASNIIFFQVQRHSDHHAWPTRRYQTLKSHADVPTMPSGYPLMFTVCLVPPLWRKIMDPRLLEVTGRKLSKLNILPGKREMLIHRYGLVDDRQAEAQTREPIPTAQTAAAAYECPGCGYTYEVGAGNVSQGFVPGTAWKDIPETWCCPDCSVRDKKDFLPVVHHH